MDTVITVEDRGEKAAKRTSPGEATSAEERALAQAALLAEELAAAWRGGKRPHAEDLLAGAPDLAAFPQAALLIVREEIRRRLQFGPPPESEEFRQRFPLWATELQALFQSHQAYSEPAESFLFPAVGETVGDCLLIAELGHGAQGRVFLATQTSLADRLVVLKMGPRDCHEHLALARLLHTHIVPLHFVQDLPVHNLRVLCTLAHLREGLNAIPVAARSGRDLLDALDRIQASRPAAAQQAGPTRTRLAGSSYVEAMCWIGACLADALQYAHERNMLHLDLKPANVLLAGDAQPLLLDFHLARPPLPPGSLPPGWFGGTPGYMAPEQRFALEAVRARKTIPVGLDRRSDVYCLGVVLFEMLGGVSTAKAMKAPRRALRRANRKVSHGLADVIAKCLELDPRQRYAEAGALAADLRRHLAHEPLQGTVNRSLVERWRKWRRRRPLALIRVSVALLFLAFFAAAGVAAWAFFNRQNQQAEAALTEADGLLRRGLPAEAERSLDRGQELAGWAPWTSALSQALASKQRQAHRARLAEELHRTADELRFHYDPETLSPTDAAVLEAACDRLWSVRRDLLAESGAEKDVTKEEQIRADFRDLAVLWVALGQSTENGFAASKDHEVLDEAELLFGPSPVLWYARHRKLPLGQEQGELRPRTAWDHYALGRELLRDGKLEQAAGALEQAVALQPQGFWPNFYQGACAYRQERFTEAEAAFRVCLALEPNCAPCFYNHGLVEAALNRPERARADYDRALQLNPALGDAWLNRGVLDMREKREEMALADLHEALGHGADPAAVHYNLALTYRSRGEKGAALGEVQQALRLRPNHAGAKQLTIELSGQ
jgi:eukaryotic-like serine/threonine-protein kinase